MSTICRKLEGSKSHNSSLDPIRLEKGLSGYGIFSTDVGYTDNPSRYDELILLVKDYTTDNRDLILAKGDTDCLFLGFWNDGVITNKQ